MADWDADSPLLRNNLTEVLRDARDRAVRRDVPTVEDARRWQRDTMAGLDVPDAKYVGGFRGEPGLETTRVWINSHEGVPPGDVARELAAFEQTLQRAVAALDARYPHGQDLDRDGLRAVIDLCAWTHAEWVRIHPFGKPKRLASRKLYVLQGLPGVGPALAHRLLLEFGCVERVVTADEEALMQVRGVGREKAARIRDVMT